MAFTEIATGSAADFLTSRIDYERTATVPYGKRNFRLDRMRQLLARLGDPHLSLPIVHVAGTKGKGSTAAMIAAALQAAGLRTALYSSPHLVRVEERLMIDSAMCPAEQLARLVAQVRPVVEAMDDADDPFQDGANRPTYFEVVTALAFLHFAEQKVDAAVLEVGMGGRLDSTNVCQPLVSVITSISFDHTQQLGTTLAAIAGEKAGIIKPGAAVVSGVLAEEPSQVVADVAARNGCSLVQLTRDFDFAYQPPRRLDLAPRAARMDFRAAQDNDAITLDGLELSLFGRHQAANAAVAVAALIELRKRGWSIDERAIRHGLAELRWPARVEVLRRHPTIVLDAAHNVASVEALAVVLDESFRARRRVLLFATTRDKDLAGMLRVLLPKFDQVVFTRYFNNPRGVAPEELEALAREIAPEKPVQVSVDPAAAWRIAQESAGRDDLIAITGSFFIADEMRSLVASNTA